MSNHARLSPSASNRWLKCTGSIEAEEQAIIENPHLLEQSSVYADTGTLAHLMAETALNHQITSTEEAFKDMGKEVDKFLDYVRSFQGKKTYLYVEQQVKLSDDLWGTADVILFDKGHLHIIDLKYGRSKVSAKSNTQLMIYALGAMKKFKKKHKIKRVSIHIAQPRIDHFEAYEVSKEELKQLKKTLKKTISTIRSGKGKLVYDSKGCFFCKAKFTCKEFADKITEFNIL